MRLLLAAQWNLMVLESPPSPQQSTQRPLEVGSCVPHGRRRHVNGRGHGQKSVTLGSASPCGSPSRGAASGPMANHLSGALVPSQSSPQQSEVEAFLRQSQRQLGTCKNDEGRHVF
mmetsp:Transcript_85133/g.249305  ORF Transcript_85133/g.249305 Transcript_85133/m.249305 type:complete len:116 (+) Transcript_85133:646-993(+)